MANDIMRVVQKSDGSFYFKCNEGYGYPITNNRLKIISQLETIKVKNPVINLDSIVQDLVKNNSSIIPKEANAYIISNFNSDTQFIVEGKAYSCYALQFYKLFNF